MATTPAGALCPFTTRRRSLGPVFGAPRHRRVYIEPMQQLREQDPSERAGGLIPHAGLRFVSRDALSVHVCPDRQSYQNFWRETFWYDCPKIAAAVLRPPASPSSSILCCT